tara:strand:+ start:342 stop:509 length:168 start_codon:yes stop_codon:yes gene_type:complete
MALTKKEVLKMFRESFTISKTDSIANREAFHNFTDSLCKGGEITLKQYENWSNPF